MPIGFGAFAGPLVCQSILAKGVPWENFYLGSLVLSAINTTLLTYAFRPTKAEYTEERQAALSALRCRTGVSETKGPLKFGSGCTSSLGSEKWQGSVSTGLDALEPSSSRGFTIIL